MPSLILVHEVTGLAGIISGVIAIAGILFRKPMAFWNAIFLLTTAAACLTGFVFLPIDGVTSAQIVGFFLIFLLAVATYARYVRHLDEGWNQIHALTTVGAVFLNVLITFAQTFLHVRTLRVLAPNQHSPVYLTVKLSLLLAFIVIALVAAKRTDRS